MNTKRRYPNTLGQKEGVDRVYRVTVTKKIFLSNCLLMFRN